MSAVIIDGVKPTLAELERFEEQPEGIDLELPIEKEDKAVTHSFSAGDNVEVCEGELINLQVSQKVSQFIKKMHQILYVGVRKILIRFWSDSYAWIMFAVSITFSHIEFSVHLSSIAGHKTVNS